jgi:hypothetical protein
VTFGFRPRCPYNYTATLKKEVLEGSRPKSQQYEAQLQFSRGWDGGRAADVLGRKTRPMGVIERAVSRVKHGAWPERRAPMISPDSASRK